MTRKRRWFVVVGIALAAGVASPALLLWSSILRGTYVEISNKGSSPITAVALTTPDGREEFGRIEPGRSRGPISPSGGPPTFVWTTGTGAASHRS